MKWNEKNAGNNLYKKFNAKPSWAKILVRIVKIVYASMFGYLSVFGCLGVCMC